MIRSIADRCRAVRVGRAVLLGAIAVAPVPLWGGQVVPPSSGSLVVDPQQVATPRPLPPPAASPATPAPVAPLSGPAPPAAVVPSLPPPVAGTPMRSSVVPGPPAVPRRPAEGGLPLPVADPLRIDPATDPVLRLARSSADPAPFRAAIAEAVRRNPALDEAAAQVGEAEALRDEAQALALPTADLTLSSFTVLSRAFSSDPGNVLERSRPRNRTDGLLRVQQPMIDWGASLDRIRAGRARLAAARAGVEDIGTQVALRAVSAWYQVYGYRALLRLAEAFIAGQRELRTALQLRIAQGAAAPADIAQVDGYIAAADSQAAYFRRLLKSAEAQYVALIGAPPPIDLGRAPEPPSTGSDAVGSAGDVERLPTVRIARLGADAARLEARASRAELLPRVGVGIDAGRYGIVETERDYDIRGNVTLSMRIGGGGAQRARQASARANGADARLRRTRIDAQRDAEIARSDVAALEAARAAIERNYLATRQSRDVLAERFRVSRGTFFDLLVAENNYFAVASRYMQTVMELDGARYALLARTGRLLPALGIAPATLDAR